MKFIIGSIFCVIQTMAAKYSIRKFQVQDRLLTSEYITNESEDTPSNPPIRIRVPPFFMNLYPFVNLSLEGVDLMEEYTEDVLLEFIPSKLPDGVTLEFINLNFYKNFTSNRRSLQGEKKPKIEVTGGLAGFRGGKPTIESLYEWISIGIQNQLLKVLQEETQFHDLKSISFESTTPTPTSAPTKLKSIDAVQGRDSLSAKSGSQVFVPLIAAICVSSLVIWLILWVSRNRVPKRERSISEILQSPEDEGIDSGPKVVNARTQSLDGSEDEGGESMETSQNVAEFAEVDSAVASEWTMTTNPTVTENSKVAKKTSRSSQSFLTTESFERDRQVSLKKDMLQTPWSTAAILPSTSKGRRGENWAADAKTNTLVPSYFSLAGRSKEGESSSKPSSTNSYDEDSAWNPDDNEVNSSAMDPLEGDGDDDSSPFVFQAHGENIVLMPPSQVRTNRF